MNDDLRALLAASEASDAQIADTRRAVLAKATTRRRSRAPRGWLVAIVLFGTPAAWAAISLVGPRQHVSHVAPPTRPSPSTTLAPTPPTTPRHAATDSEAIVAPAPVASASASATPTAQLAAARRAPGEVDLIERAHRAHHHDGDSRAALAGYDRYLASYPHGRFAPEAHWGRALALEGLGRTADARAELERFARGDWGSYRREEARARLRVTE